MEGVFSNEHSYSDLSFCPSLRRGYLPNASIYEGYSYDLSRTEGVICGKAKTEDEPVHLKVGSIQATSPLVVISGIMSDRPSRSRIRRVCRPVLGSHPRSS